MALNFTECIECIDIFFNFRIIDASSRNVVLVLSIFIIVQYVYGKYLEVQTAFLGKKIVVVCSDDDLKALHIQSNLLYCSHL